jgi:pantoate--beta-alanine ligase
VTIVRTETDLRRALGDHRSARRTIGLVPTMGALHDGHLSLVASARDRCDVVAVSVFVNPLQFGPGEDFTTYPRAEEQDVEMLRSAGADLVFIPSVTEMYAEDASTSISVGPLGDVLEGQHRPGHFNGVCIIVAKLFHIVAPDVAFFGQKDAQQVAVIKKMVRDLNFGIAIAVCPTVREADGLAMSSRNRYLSADDRLRATSLFRALLAGRSALGEGADVETAEKEMLKSLENEAGVEPDYARIVDPDTFEPPGSRGPVLLVVAAKVGPARLIDNLVWERSGASRS